ncbi:MAG: DUF2851 family protein [Weeksellaceae bacterium]|nr:DUF2851 family protein [Weeksellaceae bacterium]
MQVFLYFRVGACGMTEEFLYHIWQFKKWDFTVPLRTLCGKSVEVISPGMRNKQSGPDFSHAKLRIDGVLWAGNVEFHVLTSDWYLHQHDGDKNYENLILHIVYQHNTDAVPEGFPTLELADAVPERLLMEYKNLQKTYDFVACERYFSEVDEFLTDQCAVSWGIARLEKKVQEQQRKLEHLCGNWEALLFVSLAEAFGAPYNKIPFALLASSFDYAVLRKLVHKPGEVEALLFGQAGFLKETQDEVQREMRNKYLYTAHKHGLTPIDLHTFKFAGMRPPNFPTVRLAQLAALYAGSKDIFRYLVVENDWEPMWQLLKNVEVSAYWDNRFTLKKTSTAVMPKAFSDSFIRHIIINAVVPLKYFYYAIFYAHQENPALAILENLEAEKNQILTKFVKIGAKIENALQAQGYIALYNEHCTQKKCLECKIGNKVLNL